MASILQKFGRRKTHGLSENVDGHGSRGLAKVLTTFDLTLLGVGSTLGVGIYVLAGKVALTTGPAVCISFLIAAIASAIAAMCYAEFGARVPKAGSAYIYSYVTVGEFIAFIIGWNLILEYLIGTASVARAFSSNVDALFNYSMQHAFEEVAPMDVPLLSSYVDFFAAAITLALSVLLATGMETSSKFTNVFTFVNVGVVCFVVITGIINADPANWRIDPNTTVVSGVDLGTGGFAPFGISGIFQGAATCFFAFVGFDSIAATGEEAKNAKRSIPIAINLTLIVVFFAYFSVSVVLTLMVPYYEQDPNTPLVSAYENIEGWGWAAWTVNIGSIFGISASLLGALIPMPRIVYAMAKDGLLFRFLGVVNPRFQTPVIATAVSGVFAAIMCMIFDLDALVDMMSIGTLLAYTLVAVCVLLLRFEHIESFDDMVMDVKKRTTPLTQRRATMAVVTNCVLAIILCLLLLFGGDALFSGDAWCITLVTIVIAVIVALTWYLNMLPRSHAQPFFMVPLVPLLPTLSVIINVYLMMKLSPYTWLRFGVWMVIGLAIYFLYGIFNSTEHLIATGKLPEELEDYKPPLAGHSNEAFQHSEKKPSISNSPQFVGADEVIAVDELKVHASPAMKSFDPVPPQVPTIQVDLASIADSLRDTTENKAFVPVLSQAPVEALYEEDTKEHDVNEIGDPVTAIAGDSLSQADDNVHKDLSADKSLAHVDTHTEITPEAPEVVDEPQNETSVQVHTTNHEPILDKASEPMESTVSFEGNIAPSKGVDPAFGLALLRAREMHEKLLVAEENGSDSERDHAVGAEKLGNLKPARRNSSIRTSPQLDIVLQELTNKVSEVEASNFEDAVAEIDNIIPDTPPVTPDVTENETPSSPPPAGYLFELKGAFQRLNDTAAVEEDLVSISPTQVSTIVPDLPRSDAITATSENKPSATQLNSSPIKPRSPTNVSRGDRVQSANEDYKKIYNMFNGK